MSDKVTWPGVAVPDICGHDKTCCNSEDFRTCDCGLFERMLEPHTIKVRRSPAGLYLPEEKDE